MQLNYETMKPNWLILTDGLRWTADEGMLDCWPSSERRGGVFNALETARSTSVFRTRVMESHW